MALVVAAAVLACLPAAADPAGAQTEPGDRDVQLTVQRLTGSLTPGGELEVQARVSNRGGRTAEGLRVVGTLHSAVASRFAFQMAVDDGQLGAVVDGFSAEIGELDEGRSTRVELSRSAAELGFRRADQFGVYPLRLQLLDEGDVVDEVTTALVFTSEEVEEPVRTALLVPASASPLLGADGAYEQEEVIAEFGRAGRVQGLVGSLAARRRFPATLAPDALLLDTAADLAGGFTARDPAGEEQEVAPRDHLAMQAGEFLARAGEVATRRGVDLLAMPYARADLDALVHGGMTDEAARHVREGRDTLDALLGAAPLPEVLWPPDVPSAGTLALLADEVDAIVVSERHLDIPVGRSLSPSPVRTLAASRGRSPTLLVPDPWLEDVLAREGAPDGVAVAVQRVVAEAAAVYFERPFAADVRGLLLAPPQAWSPARGMAGGLMDALAEAPWVEPVTLSELAEDVAPESRSVRLDRSGARARELPGPYVAALAEARRALGSFARVLAVADDTPSQFDRMLRAAASVEFRGAPAEGRRLIAAVAGTVAGLYSAVTIEEGPQVWMDAEGPVPVTVANSADVPLRVRVRLESQRFVFDEEPTGQPPDDEGGWVIPPNDRRTLTFQATAVTPGGRAPVSVVVEDVDGAVVLARSTVVVRSTAVSVAALIVTAGAGIFIVVWLVGQVARRRRRADPDGESPPVPQPTAQAGGSRRR